VEQAVAVLWLELALLVGGEALRILVDGHAIGIARQEIAAVRHAVHRGVLAQRAVYRIGVGIEGGRQAPEVEVADGRPRKVGIGEAGRGRAGDRCRGHLPFSRTKPQVAGIGATANPPNWQSTVTIRKPPWRSIGYGRRGWPSKAESVL